MLSLILDLFYPEPKKPSGSLASLRQRSTGLALFTRRGSEPAAVFKARGNVTERERERETTRFLLDRLSTAADRRQAVSASTQAHTCMQTHTTQAELWFYRSRDWSEDNYLHVVTAVELKKKSLVTLFAHAAQEERARSQVYEWKKWNARRHLTLWSLHHSRTGGSQKHRLCLRSQGGHGLVSGWLLFSKCLKKERDTKHCGRPETSNSRSRCLLGFSCREWQEIRDGKDANNKSGKEEERKNPGSNPT